MRRRILKVIPDAEQGISYGVPVFRVDGKVVAGLAAFKSHLSYLPHSGSVLPVVADKTRGYTQPRARRTFRSTNPFPKNW